MHRVQLRKIHISATVSNMRVKKLVNRGQKIQEQSIHGNYLQNDFNRMYKTPNYQDVEEYSQMPGAKDRILNFLSQNSFFGVQNLCHATVIAIKCYRTSLKFDYKLTKTDEQLYERRLEAHKNGEYGQKSINEVKSGFTMEEALHSISSWEYQKRPWLVYGDKQLTYNQTPILFIS